MDNRPLASHGGDRWAAQEKWGIAADEFLDFSASINPLGPSSYSLQAIQDNLSGLDHYPEPSGAVLKRALAQYLKVEEQYLVLGNGSSELIYLCARLFYRHRVLVLAPSFSEYGQGVINPCIVRVGLDLSTMRLPLDELSALLREGDLLFIANPNNPTANLFNREELLQILQLVKNKQAMLILDETFIDFIQDRSVSLRDISSQGSNLVILGSLTKFFALPGLRIGYALSSRDNIVKMERLLPPWRINNLALAAGAAALQDQEYIRNTLSLITRERAFLIDGLDKIAGLTVYPSQANYILIDAGNRGITAAQLQSRLGPEGILIRDCRNFYNLSPGCLRVAVRSHRENVIFLRTLRKVLD